MIIINGKKLHLTLEDFFVDINDTDIKLNLIFLYFRVFRVPPPSGLPYLDRREGREVRNTRVELHKRETRDEREISQNLPTLPSNKRR